MGFGHVVLIIHGIGPWYYNKAYLQVNNIHGKVGVNIHGSCHIVEKYFDCETSYDFLACVLLISHVISPCYYN